MRVRYTTAAAGDRDRIVEYFRANAPDVLPRLSAAIDVALRRLVEFPSAGFKTDIPDVRVLFINRFRYKIFYRVRSNVEILHIRHTRTRPR